MRQLLELGVLVETGDDGGFDVDIEPGQYWVCLGTDPLPTGSDDVLVTLGCARGTLGQGEAILVWTNASRDTPLVSYGVKFDPGAPHSWDDPPDPF